MMAIGELTVEQFFAGLYANTNMKDEPMSAGRQMGGHFMTHSLNEDGSWKNLMQQKNSSADISPTAGQMPRLLGLAQASKIYRHVEGIDAEKFSNNGNEIAWGTIGNASTSEGHFWETFNAAGVMQVPMVINVWDDDYGISVHARHQTTKENISEILKGFQKEHDTNGYEIIVVKAWDYPGLIDAYEKAETIAREQHIPVLLHVVEVTQPQGHSTSGSHERYKSKDRLQWEREHDCNLKMREWMIANGFSTSEELDELEKSIKREVREGKKAAWAAFGKNAKIENKTLIKLLTDLANSSPNKNFISSYIQDLKDNDEPVKSVILATARKALRYAAGETSEAKAKLVQWINDFKTKTQPDYSSHLWSEYEGNATNIQAVEPTYDKDAEAVDARIILRDNFDKIFETRPETLIFGEDAGEIGDVNQGLEGLQEKYGKLRVADIGIREATILGQGIGMSLRGLRPIAEIQYLDYLLYALQIMSDDLATTSYRTRGKQKSPLIVRTRGHRLEGIWHSGSPMGGILNLIHGVNILVPRNMTKAAGFYNTMLESDEPALIVECLNGYRLKEKKPNNFGEFKTPVGVVETIRSGSDITIVSYGSTLRIVEQAAQELQEVGIDTEIIDCQSLLPFDIHHDIAKSLEKTNRLLVVDEDVPGGASAYIMQHILEVQNAYRYLDSKPNTLTAKAHRPAYGTDGDYFSKPSAEDVFEKVYAILREFKPDEFPKLF
jgi:pyruvate/2-oxoglutarate/acetoin dehydrogenase E1 component/TPP-dependent pyruvate/acetoin dehydrogenase alpha subunit